MNTSMQPRLVIPSKRKVLNCLLKQNPKAETFFTRRRKKFQDLCIQNRLKKYKSIRVQEYKCGKHHAYTLVPLYSCTLILLYFRKFLVNPSPFRFRFCIHECQIHMFSGFLTIDSGIEPSQ